LGGHANRVSRATLLSRRYWLRELIMSTQERVSVTGWWLEYVRRVVVQWVRKTTVFATLNFNILFRPTQTSTQIIKDDEAAGVVRALKYYSKMFALAFTIQLFASRFRLWEGLSEWRLLVQFGLELLIAIPIIYVLSRVLPERIPFLRVVQAALYVDGLYMVIDRIVSIPISYLYLVVPSENRELDIFGKEFERCLSNSSIFYWLLRGDLITICGNPQIGQIGFLRTTLLS
jgi:hypothetical protein